MRPDHEAGGRRRRGRGRRRRGRRGRGRRVESSQDAHVGNFETLGEDHEVRQGRELHVALTLVCRCHFSVRVHFSVLMVALHFRPSFFDRRGPGYKAPPASGAVARRLFCSCRFSACRQFCCLAVVLHFRHFFFPSARSCAQSTSGAWNRNGGAEKNVQFHFLCVLPFSAPEVKPLRRVLFSTSREIVIFNPTVIYNGRARFSDLRARRYSSSQSSSGVSPSPPAQ